MPLSIGVGGAWKTAPALWVGVGGAWKPVAAAWIGVGGAWKVAFSALAVTAADLSVDAGGFSASGTAEGDMTAPTVTGGSGTYTYLWERVSGDIPAITGDTSATPHFGATVTDGDPNISVWKVTVTDSVYGVSAEDTATITLNWINQE